jgi:hypothetical protein
LYFLPHRGNSLVEIINPILTKSRRHDTYLAPLKGLVFVKELLFYQAYVPMGQEAFFDTSFFTERSRSIYGIIVASQSFHRHTVGELLLKRSNLMYFFLKSTLICWFHYFSKHPNTHNGFVLYQLINSFHERNYFFPFFF